MFADKSLKLIVIVSMTDWSEPPRIRHQVTRQLDKIYNILYVQLYSGSSKSMHSVEFQDGIAFLKLGFSIKGLGRLFYLFPLIEILFGNYVKYFVRKSILELGYRTATLVNFQFNLVELCHSSIFNKKIYICNDDFVNMHPHHSPGRKHYSLLRQNEVCRSVDHIFAVSEYLCGQINESLGMNKASLLKPSAEYFHFNPKAVRTLSPKSSRIRVAFMGYIDDRVDWKIMEALYKDKRFEISLIGPVDSGKVYSFLNYPDVQLLEPLYGVALLEQLSKQDVLLIPYDVSHPAVQATSVPNKFFQYLNAGRPVVVSNMSGFIHCEEGILYKAIDEDDFVRQVLNANNSDTEFYVEQRLFHAKENSWDVRIKVIVDAIEG